MGEKRDWAAPGRYMESTTLRPIGLLNRHPTEAGCWVGTMKHDGADMAIVIYEGTQRSADWREGGEDEPNLILFENPAATLLMRDAEDEQPY